MLQLTCMHQRGIIGCQCRARAHTHMQKDQPAVHQNIHRQVFFVDARFLSVAPDGRGVRPCLPEGRWKKQNKTPSDVEKNRQQSTFYFSASSQISANYIANSVNTPAAHRGSGSAIKPGVIRSECRGASLHVSLLNHNKKTMGLILSAASRHAAPSQYPRGPLPAPEN